MQDAVVRTRVREGINSIETIVVLESEKTDGRTRIFKNGNVSR